MAAEQAGCWGVHHILSTLAAGVTSRALLIASESDRLRSMMSSPGPTPPDDVITWFRCSNTLSELPHLTLGLPAVPRCSLLHPRTPVAMLGPPSLLSAHRRWLFTLRTGPSASLDLCGVLLLCTSLPPLRSGASVLRSALRSGCARLPPGHQAPCQPESAGFS